MTIAPEISDLRRTLANGEPFPTYLSQTLQTAQPTAFPPNEAAQVSNLPTDGYIGLPGLKTRPIWLSERDCLPPVRL
jgi:hypothetical protein